jgi:hypothetical protein
MVIKQNDLDVFDFLITTTKGICVKQAAAAGTGFVQTNQVEHVQVQLCDAHAGSALRFSDSALQAKFDRVLMKASRDLLKNVVVKTQSSQMSLLQSNEERQPASAKKVKVTSGRPETRECPPIRDCGLLYDTLSLEWGKYKDEVDALKKIMADNEAAWLALKAGFDAQIESLMGALATCNAQLAEAVSKKKRRPART